MKKILLILAIALVWSANAEAMRVIRTGSCVKLNAKAVTEVTEQSNNDMTFSATYGNKAPRVTIGNGDCGYEDSKLAIETGGYSRNNILLQAAQSMLAQANQAPQGVLSLLQ